MNTHLKDNTVYVVSGYMRTGTSMMMRALEAGGMKAMYRKSREVMRKSYKDSHYDPNIGGLYELESQDYSEIGFPEKYQGKLIKCLMGGVNNFAVMPKIKIVFMRRDFEEIRQSYQAFFGNSLPIQNEKFEKRIELTLAQLKNRKDVESIDIFWMREVINDPVKYFTILKNHGWDIDIQKAVEVVDPQYYRFRKENLTNGIV